MGGNGSRRGLQHRPNVRGEQRKIKDVSWGSGRGNRVDEQGCRLEGQACESIKNLLRTGWAVFAHLGCAAIRRLCIRPWESPGWEI